MVHLRSLYTNALSMGTKQELEATRVLGRCDLGAITENWWGECMTGVWLSRATDFSDGLERTEGWRVFPLHQEIERL